MFAEDAGLLPNRMLTQTLRSAQRYPDRFEPMLRQLFAAMREPGGLFGPFPVPWFDGGLFDSDDALPLSPGEIARVLEAAERDWSEIDVSVMGTLFERGLDPAKRGPLGAHYTDRDKIMLIVEPVVVRPLVREWNKTKQAIQALLEREG